MRRTKIVATVGPATSSSDGIDALVRVGVDVFRLNFSHGTHAAHAEAVTRIRAAATRAGRHVSVMQDLSGPKIRTGPLAGGEPLVLRDGEHLRVGAGDRVSRAGAIYTPYGELVASARPGDRLLLDDGRLELRVVGRDEDGLTAVVVNGGLLGAHKGINAPGVALPASAVTEKDVADLEFGLTLGIDAVAISFVQTANDLRRARDVIGDGRRVQVIAKIERPAAVDNLSSILEGADAVMVARGDLGLEMPLERVPGVQKAIMRAARALGRPAILATQVLESMRTEPRPTRAEVSDAANAVNEGADAIMLAGETAIGGFPVRAVQTLDAIIREAERLPGAERVELAVDPTGSRHGRALCEAGVTLARTGAADAIVAVTHEGRTAQLLSSLRASAPILGVTSDERVANRLSLWWGVTPVVGDAWDADATERIVLERGLVARGSIVVFINVSADLNRRGGNFLTLRKLG